jgi:uncharacterized phage protein (TIGR01671 family)
MRKIKFRAWDKTNNKWYMDGKIFDLNYSGSYGDFYFDNDYPNDMRKVKLEWVEFTGLLDKNGKEVYEGDILNCFRMTDDNLMYWDQDPDTGEALAHYTVKWSTKDAMYFLPSDNENWEVIGNIYENPELLERTLEGK